MSKQSPAPSGLTFEKSEQEDALMERIFENIQDVPDKDPPSELPPETLRQPSKTSPFSAISRADDELDLHGKTREEAIMMVQNFVKICHTDRLRTALIITGRGHHSGSQGPVLKQEVLRWLKRNGKPYLHDFQDAPPHFGGSGALWLIFK